MFVLVHILHLRYSFSTESISNVHTHSTGFLFVLCSGKSVVNFYIFVRLRDIEKYTRLRMLKSLIVSLKSA